MSGKQTALARVELPSTPLASIAKVTEAFERLSECANLITPVAAMDYIPQMHRVSLRAVVIDPESQDVYQDRTFCGANERSLGKTALLKLWQAAGGSIVESRRTDDGMDAKLCEWRCVLRMQQLDGRVIEVHGNKRIDFRPGSDQIKGWSEKRLNQARQYVESLAESKAMLRAVRTALGLRQKYTVEELRKPFVVPALVPDLDTSDPEIRRMVAAQAMGLTNALYGPTPIHAPRIDVPRGVDPETGELTEPESETDYDLPPEEPAFRCSCPHGCDAELTEEEHAHSTEKLETDRCRRCWPSAKLFDADLHSEMPDGAGLEIPARPRLTIGKIREVQKRGAV